MWGRAGKTFAGLVGTLLFLGGAGRLMAQATVPQTAITTELRQLTAAAQTIFVGQIVKIERRGGIVEVSFRVEQPLVGAVGPTFTMREWAGLWAPQVQRYTVGQRVLAFVHGSSGAGLSSPVHGAEGLVPVVVQGARSPRLLDARRVAAGVVRAPGSRLLDEQDGALPLDGTLALLGLTQGAAVVGPGGLPIPVRARPPVQLSGVKRATVLGTAGDRLTAVPVAEPVQPFHSHPRGNVLP